MTAQELIKRHEGLRLGPYIDTADKITIGYGRNLTDNGITEAEADVMFEHDFQVAQRTVESLLPRCASLPDPQRAVLINMAFNLGLPRLSGFKKMLAAVKAGDFDKTADEMLDSRWAGQVGTRAIELADLMRGDE